MSNLTFFVVFYFGCVLFNLIILNLLYNREFNDINEFFTPFPDEYNFDCHFLDIMIYVPIFNSVILFCVVFFAIYKIFGVDNLKSLIKKIYSIYNNKNHITIKEKVEQEEQTTGIKKCCKTCIYCGDWGCNHPLGNCYDQNDANNRWVGKFSK